MCAIDACDDYVAFSSQTKRRAAKDHHCGECGRTIAKGELYERSTGKTDYEFWDCKTCEHCIEARRWLTRVCHGFVYNAVKQDLAEHVGRGEESMVGDLHLYRIVHWMDRRWAYRPGSDELWHVAQVKAEVDLAIAAYVAKEAKAA